MERLLIIDVAAVLIFFLNVAACAHVRRILRELKNVRTEKTEAVLNRILERADRRHDRDDREDTDGDSKHRQARTQFVQAQGRQRQRYRFAKWHVDLLFVAKRRNGVYTRRRPGGREPV